MRLRILALAFIFGLATLLHGQQPEAPKQKLPPAQCLIDKVHSSVIFRIKNRGVNYVYGRFNQLDGAVFFDQDTPANTWIDVRVSAQSIDTNAPKRDEHLRSKDFFNAGQHQLITFLGKGAKPLGEDKYEMTGELTLLGIKKPLTIQFQHTGTMVNQHAKQIGGQCSFTIKRSDFGMNFGINQNIDDEVLVVVSLAANHPG